MKFHLFHLYVLGFFWSLFLTYQHFLRILLRLSNYLHSQLAISFFPIFLGLSFITSIVFLVKIVSLTSIIKMDFLDLFWLYLYTMPQIIFFTLPVTFFMSLVISVSRLSSEYELAVISSLELAHLK